MRDVLPYFYLPEDDEIARLVKEATIVLDTNVLLRLYELGPKEREQVLGDALLRLSACVLIEAHDERLDTDRRYLPEASTALLYPTPPIALPAQAEETIATLELTTA